MTRYSYDLAPDTAPKLGLIVLQTDVSLEDEARRMLPEDVSLLVSRVPSSTEVTRETLAQMEAHLGQAAGLFPDDRTFDAVGYGCTSGTAQIGADQVAACIREGTQARHITNPVTALRSACERLAIGRLAILSPYVEAVSDHLRTVLQSGGIETPVVGSFGEAEEARVARIAPQSIMKAATDLLCDAEVDALFLSCTNLRTLEVIAPLQEHTGLPVLSSNLVLIWHLLRSGGVIDASSRPADLLPRARQ